MKRPSKQILACLLSSAVMAGMMPTAAVSAVSADTSNVIIHDTAGSLSITDETANHIAVINSVEDYENYTAKIEGPRASKGVSKLPSKVDNSANENAIYLPPVRDQGDIGACVAWSTVYYQYTYTINKAKGIPTTDFNTYSPNFAYNLVNGSTNGGTFSYRVYDLLKNQGAVTIKDVPIKSTSQPQSNYLDWYAYDGIWEKALDNRILSYTYYYSGDTSDTFYAQHGAYLDQNDAPITSPDSENLRLLKQVLADGKILSFDSNISKWHTTSVKDASKASNPQKYTIDNSAAGEYIAISQIYNPFSGTGHEMTIVGYNDEIWTDINNNNIVDEGEMGAFKMINSFGTGDWYMSEGNKMLNNDGFLWIAYDALNWHSSVSGVSDEIQESILHAVSSMEVNPHQNNDSGYNLRYCLNTSARDSSPVTVTAVDKVTGEVISGNAVPFDYKFYSPSVSRSCTYAGEYYADASDGMMTIDLETIVPKLAEKGLESYDWSVTIGNYNNVYGNTVTVKDIRIVDKKAKKEYPMNAVAGFTFTEQTKTVNIPISDEPAPQNQITIYYKGYSTPYIHYQIETGTWTDVPGKAMTKTNEVSGYTHKYTIDLGTKEYINACFNNGGNSWDSRNGANYRFEKGTYTYSNGTIKTYEPPKPKELYADISLSAKTIPTKQSVTVSVSAAGGTAPYQYQYSYERNGSETVVKNYSSDSSANISISSAGLYTVKVSIKDATGKTIQKTADLTAATVTIGSLSTNKASAKTGESVTFNTSVNDGNVPVSCSYTITGNGTSQTLAADSDNSVTWKPTKEGTYTITVNALYNGVSVASKSMTYKVEKGADVVLNQITIYYKGYSTPYIHYQTGSGTWTTAPGKAMTKTSELSGYTHKYTIDLGNATYANVCFNDGNNNWDSRNGANYYFEKGTYTYSNGTITVYQPSQPKELSGNISLSSQKVSVNQSVTVTASATGGTAPYQYKYSYTKNNKETLIKDFSTSVSASFKPDTVGTYSVKVIIKDAAGATIQKTVNLTVSEVTVNQATIYYKGYSTPYIHYQIGTGAWTDVPGKAMTKTSEMNGYTHKYTIDLGTAGYANVCFNDGNNSWDSRNGANYRFEKGTYTYSNGTVNQISETTGGSQGTSYSALNNLSEISSGTIVLGGTFNVNASAAGGTGSYTYAVLYKKSYDTKWTVKQNYSNNDTVTVKPAKATSYDVCVKVKDSDGSIIKKFFTVQVNAKLTNTSMISATTIKKGETVTLKGFATGGMGNYQYAVLYKKKSETKWTTRQGYKANDEIIVRPYTNTDYDICIKVKDEDGTISKKYFTVKVTK